MTISSSVDVEFTIVSLISLQFDQIPLHVSHFLVVRPTGIGILGDVLFRKAEMKLDNDYRL